MLKLIITEGSPTRVDVGLVIVKTKTTGLGVKMEVAYTSPEKCGDVLILRKIHVCACIWRTEINYLENKNGHDWV